jgi:putative chitobiose transport system substrate-binding protein
MAINIGAADQITPATRIKKRAAADPYFSKLPAKPNAEDYARYMGAKALEYTRTPFLANVKNLGELNKNFEENMEAAIHGQKPVKRALEDAAAFWNKMLGAK